MLINLSTKAPPVPFGGGKKGARSVVTEAFYALDDVEDMTFSAAAAFYHSGR